MQFMTIVVDWIRAEDMDFVSSEEGAEDEEMKLSCGAFQTWAGGGHKWLPPHAST